MTCPSSSEYERPRENDCSRIARGWIVCSTPGVMEPQLSFQRDGYPRHMCRWMNKLTSRCNSRNVPDNRESQSGNKFSISRFGSISVRRPSPTISDRTGAEVLPVHAVLTSRVRRCCEPRSKCNGSTNKSCGACIGLIVIATRFLQAGIAVIRQFARGLIGALRIDMQPWNTSQFDWAVSSSS